MGQKFVGGDGSGRRVFDEPLTQGATVRSVLRGLSTRFPELHRALWNGEALVEHIEVLVNDAVLDIRHTLDSALEPGDRIAPSRPVHGRLSSPASTSCTGLRDARRGRAPCLTSPDPAR